jgi:hypothetical protein
MVSIRQFTICHRYSFTEQDWVLSPFYALPQTVFDSVPLMFQS